MGKEIGGAVYVHRAYEYVLGDIVRAARERLPSDFEYTVVKYVPRTGAVTFVASPDFDTEPEPTVGDMWRVPTKGAPVYTPERRDPYIYHHKWLMVCDDYAGFGVSASEERSRQCLAATDIDRRRGVTRKRWRSVTLSE